MKALARVSLPLTLATLTETVPEACAGVVTCSVVAFTNVVAAAIPSMEAVVAAVKLLPLKVTTSPPRGEPLLGLTALTVGGAL